MQIKRPKQKNTGFTLIELLVSIALFSVVITIALGSIITIADSNKKARSMMQIMNNLNFAVDSMTRSFKSGDVADIVGSFVSSSGRCFETNEIDYADFDLGARRVEYCVDGNGVLTKKVDTLNDSGGVLTNNPPVQLTSGDVVIETVEFIPYGVASGQPALGIVLDGEVRITPTISSRFTINTSVSQRKLDIND